MQDTNKTLQPFLNGMLIHSQHNNNSTLPTVSAILNLDDTKRTSLITSSTDDISLSKTIESNSRISFNSNIQNTSIIPENSSNNESLLDDAAIGYILNMLDTIGLDQNQELELQFSKLDSGYAKV
ncbi:hypothetical protein F8M41_004912 [Gigaspora margarita]|uniref:Uncharacterized protein n=1 Tax=Gigaspora margarita TaxID=4874 RepID=A0A8H3XBI7_GIGMA|nr:hypothetical protein F8M41_004912 [Gigaspora margarita]